MIIPQPPAAGPDPGQPGHYAHHDWLEASVEALDNVLTAEPVWIAPTLGNGWLAYGAPFEPPGYYKDSNGFVHLRGLIKSGTVGTGTTGTVWTMPAGYIPPYTHLTITAASGGAYTARVDVVNDGAVRVMALGTTATNAFVSLAMPPYWAPDAA